MCEVFLRVLNSNVYCQVRTCNVESSPIFRVFEVVRVGSFFFILIIIRKQNFVSCLVNL